MVFRAFAIAAFFLAAALPAQAKGVLPVTAKKIEMKSPIYEISIVYPQTGNRAIDADLGQWARAKADDFAKEAKEDRQPDDRAYYLDVSYEVARNDGRIFAVFFSEETDTGGAHPNHDFYTTNYLMPDGWRIYLPELLAGPRALKKLSALVSADLIRTITTGNEPLSDPETVRSGTGPDWDNFKDFVWMPGKLAIHFPPYQVASYASGPQESDIPLSALKDVMRADPRVPVPSFDCAKAETAVEKSICSDLALARLDREVSEAYGRWLTTWDSDQNKQAYRQHQRDWMHARAAACPAGPGQTGCLKALYRARLAELRKLP